MERIVMFGVVGVLIAPFFAVSVLAESSIDGPMLCRYGGPIKHPLSNQDVVRGTLCVYAHNVNEDGGYCVVGADNREEYGSAMGNESWERCVRPPSMNTAAASSGSMDAYCVYWLGTWCVLVNEDNENGLRCAVGTSDRRAGNQTWEFCLWKGKGVMLS